MPPSAPQPKTTNEDDSTFQTGDYLTQNAEIMSAFFSSRVCTRICQYFKDSVPYYRSSAVQLGLIAFISFLCPGMFNALTGLGGGGLVQAGPANSANIVLYSTFSIVGFFAGVAVNKLGVRITLSIGALGYSLYASSLLCYKHTQNVGFLLFAGMQLGVCAGIFWAAQSMTAISYPTGQSTGKSLSWFWIIYNLGAVLGSVVALGQNLHSGGSDISDSTFYIITALSLLGTGLALLLSEAELVLRSDGTNATLVQSPTWKSELEGCISALRCDYYILLLFPMFFASNFFYPYQFNTFNLQVFTIRTRSLNNALYWLSEMAGASVIGPLLDSKRLTRPVKARLALVALLLATCGIWGGAFAWQRRHETMTENRYEEMINKQDFMDDGYAIPMLLYMAFGLLASAYQTCLLWIVRSLTDDSRKIANFVGFYKGVQSAGGAVSFRVNTLGLVPSHELGICWGLLAGSLLVAAPLAMLQIQDHESDATVDEMREV